MAERRTKANPNERKKTQEINHKRDRKKERTTQRRRNGRTK